MMEFFFISFRMFLFNIIASFLVSKTLVASMKSLACVRSGACPSPANDRDGLLRLKDLSVIKDQGKTKCFCLLCSVFGDAYVAPKVLAAGGMASYLPFGHAIKSSATAIRGMGGVVKAARNYSAAEKLVMPILSKASMKSARLAQVGWGVGLGALAIEKAFNKSRAINHPDTSVGTSRKLDHHFAKP
jgi:hypothetical protein